MSGFTREVDLAPGCNIAGVLKSSCMAAPEGGGRAHRSNGHQELTPYPANQKKLPEIALNYAI